MHQSRTIHERHIPEKRSHRKRIAHGNVGANRTRDTSVILRATAYGEYTVPNTYAHTAPEHGAEARARAGNKKCNIICMQMRTRARRRIDDDWNAIRVRYARMK